MHQYFVLLGAKDRKILLENARHRCPRCKHHDSVQLTRFENELVIFNKKIGLLNHMNVLYNCKLCNWKNEALPDDDPCFAATNNDQLFVGSNIMSETPSPNSDISLESSSSPSPSSSRRPSAVPSWKKRGFSLKRKTI